MSLYRTEGTRCQQTYLFIPISYTLIAECLFLIQQHWAWGLGEKKPPATRLAIRFESFVESDSALRSMPVERQSEEDLLWHSLMHKSRHVLEPEFLVVIRVSHETTSLSIHIFQT